MTNRSYKFDCKSLFNSNIPNISHYRAIDRAADSME